MDETKVRLTDCSEVSSRDIYMRLCACRDFEIKLQWERAVFLTAFLIACFSGYGAFALSVHQHGNGFLSGFVVKLIPVCISFVGVILSLFWILMAKGSKAWYEHYECAITAYSQLIGKQEELSPVSSKVLGHNWVELRDIKRKSMSDSIFKLKGGCYSVSKIVIAIGILSLLIWASLFLTHVVIFFAGPVSGWNRQFQWVVIGIGVGIGVVSICIFLVQTIKNPLTSDYLKKVAGLPEEGKK